MRAFSVEVEFRGSIDTAVRAIRDLGYPVRRGTYSQWSRTEWYVCPDGSVSSGGELKSRSLDFDSAEDREELTKVLNALRQAGCGTVESAGIHVNIDAPNLNAEQLGAVLRSYIRYEDIIWKIASSGWRRVRSEAWPRYAKIIPEATVKTLIRKKELQAFKQAYYNHGGGKYSCFSLDKWFRGGVIEFRAFNSSMNPKRILAYTALCMAFVQDAKNGYKRALGKSIKLGTMVSGEAGLQEGNKQYKWMRHVLTDVAGMTQEDAKLLDMCWKDSTPQERPTSPYIYR